jgi:hypothetical protein
MRLDPPDEMEAFVIGIRNIWKEGANIESSIHWDGLTNEPEQQKRVKASF